MIIGLEEPNEGDIKLGNKSLLKIRNSYMKI